jgi:predicted lactoylglutathione lyase
MNRLVLKDGTIPTEETLAGDDLVKQMLDKAKEEGKTSVKVPEPKEVIQAATADDLKEHPVVKQMVETAVTEAKKSPDKAAVIQSLTADDLKDHKAITEMVETGIKEGIKQVKFSADVISAFKSGYIKTADDDKDAKSVSQRMYDERKELSL